MDGPLHADVIGGDDESPIFINRLRDHDLIGPSNSRGETRRTKLLSSAYRVSGKRHLHGWSKGDTMVGTTSERTAVLRQVATFLRDLSAARDVATLEERNALARTVSQSVDLAGERVTAITRQPDFAPFFNPLDSSCGSSENDDALSVTAANLEASTLAGGSDGDRLRHQVTPDLASW